MVHSITPFLMLVSVLIWFNGCETLTGPDDEPDIPDAPYVWRVCNQHDRFEMRNVVIGVESEEEPHVVDKILPVDCTDYMMASEKGEYLPHTLSYKQHESSIVLIYLDAQPANRGLVDEDSLWIREVPGRYTYHCHYDSTRRRPIWFEIEREAYH